MLVAAGRAADGFPVGALSNQNDVCHQGRTMGRNSSTEAPEFQVTACVSCLAKKRWPSLSRKASRDTRDRIRVTRSVAEVEQFSTGNSIVLRERDHRCAFFVHRAIGSALYDSLATAISYQRRLRRLAGEADLLQGRSSTCTLSRRNAGRVCMSCNQRLLLPISRREWRFVASKAVSPRRHP